MADFIDLDKGKYIFKKNCMEEGFPEDKAFTILITYITVASKPGSS